MTKSPIILEIGRGHLVENSQKGVLIYFLCPSQFCYGNIYQKINTKRLTFSFLRITEKIWPKLIRNLNGQGVTLQMVVVVGCHFVFKVRKSYSMPSFGNVHQMTGGVLFVLKKSENHLALPPNIRR